MKKTYIIPEIKIVKIGVAQMIAASTELGVSETHYDGTHPLSLVSLALFGTMMKNISNFS